MEQSKKPALLLLARILGAARVPYAVIGGVAMQIRHDEPRTTLDIDLAVTDRALIPRAAMVAAGFAETGKHANYENWLGPESTPVQITDDPSLVPAVLAAEAIRIEGVDLRVLRAVDLLHVKLRSGADPGRRRSKRLQDLADAQALLEKAPELRSKLTEDESALLDSLPR